MTRAQISGTTGYRAAAFPEESMDIGQDPSSKRREIVYLVDDDARVRDALCGVLTSAGLCVERFPSAEAFLEQPPPIGRPVCCSTCSFGVSAAVSMFKPSLISILFPSSS